MSSKIVFKITDYIEQDLTWEEEECINLGIDFHHYQMRDASPAELIENFKDADILLTNMAGLSAEVIDGLDNVKVLLRHGIGYDKVDVDAATRNGIIFANEATASSEDVAEHAVMLMLETFRKKKLQDKALERWIHTRKWSSEGINPLHRMKGKTLGIVGCGNIGSLVLEKMSGFGMEILVCDPYLAEKRCEELGIQHTPIDKLLGKADIITIHMPVTKETRWFFDLAKFKRMKKMAVIVNTSRGPIIKTEDLKYALKNGLISGAGLDVYEEEPPHAGDEILTMENVILSPHIAWYSEEGGWDIRHMIMDDVKAVLKGGLPNSIVNQEVLESSVCRLKRHVQGIS